MDEGVFGHLMSWALRGVVGAVVGGPPCRTVSPCRVEGDGGPPPVRGREEHRWGLPGLPGNYAALLLEDNTSCGCVSCFYTGPTGSGGLELPIGIADPLQLAQWALRKAAENLRSSGGVVDSALRQERGVESKGMKVFFVWEHPTDPEEYMPANRRPRHGWASWWVFPEWDQFVRTYGIYLARFDQGKMFHPRPKPTTVATTSWALYEGLDQQFLSKEWVRALRRQRSA